MIQRHSVAIVDALNQPVPRFPVEPDQDAGGQPSVGSIESFALGDARVGIWELGVGGMYDVEIDEVFVILAGDATIEVLDDSGLVTERTDLRPGMLCRLYAGTRTRWVVRRTLRKVYVLREPED